MNRFIIHFCLIIAACLTLFPGDSVAADGDFDLGLRGIVVGAGGEPANDMMGYGLFGRYHLNDRWVLGFSVESLGFDAERPYEFIGIVGDPAFEIDSTTDSTSVNVWIERVYTNSSSRLEWFWGAGVGFASLDAEDITGPTADGGTYYLVTDIGMETLLSGSAGMRVLFGGHWYFEAALRADQHFTDWTIVDEVSGITGTVGDYFSWGGNLGVGFRF